MPRSRTPKAEIVLDLLRKHPDAASRTLAIRAVHDHPHLFSEDQARTMIRYYRGAGGNRKRETISDTSHFREHGMAGENPFSDLPDPIGGWEELNVRKVRGKLIGVISDLHYPFYDQGATELALLYLKDAGIDALILLGDGIDFYSISRWPKDPSIVRLRDEIAGWRQFLAILRREFPGIPIVYKAGNHEERWERLLEAKAPVLLEDEETRGVLSFAQVFHLNKLRIKYSPRTERLQAGQISMIHGHEFWGSISSAVNAARGLYLKARSTAMCGHLHHTSQHTEGNLKGKQISCFSVGCLCGLAPYYAPINKWNHGFALIDKEAEHQYSVVRNLRIIDGEVV